MDRGYIERNEASRARLRALLDRLSDEDLGRKVGDWTVAMSLAHLAFWDHFSPCAGSRPWRPDATCRSPSAAR